jgi:molybdenum cofactor cytidylyltransferase
LNDFFIIFNDKYKEGLSTSLKIGIKNIFTPWTMIFLGDMPEIKKEFIEILLSKKSNKFAAYYLSYNGQKGFPVLINNSLYPKISEIQGDKGLRTILKDKNLACDIKINDQGCITDIDEQN